MASRASSGYNKPELVAIYRLEFYRNKKKWKFSNEKKKESAEPACIQPKIEPKSKDSWNTTYDVPSGTGSEKENSPPNTLNNAFMQESTDDIEGSPTTPPSTPRLNEDFWPDPAAEPGANSFPAEKWSNSRISTDSRPQLHELQQAVEAFSYPSQTASIQQSTENTCEIQHQANVNLLRLPKTSDESLAKQEFTNNQKSVQEPWPQTTDVCANEPPSQSPKNQHKINQQLCPPTTNISVNEPTPGPRHNQQNVDQQPWRSSTNIWEAPNIQLKINQEPCRSTNSIWTEPTPPNNQHKPDQEPRRPITNIWTDKPAHPNNRLRFDQELCSPFGPNNIWTNEPTPAPLNYKQKIDEQFWPPTGNIWTSDPTPESQKLNFHMLFSHPPPPIINNSQLAQQNTCSRNVSTTPIHNNQNIWSVPPPTLAGPLQQEGMLASLLKRQAVTDLYDKIEKGLQPPPANSLQMLLCPDNWKKQTIPGAGRLEDQCPDPPSKPEPELLKLGKTCNQQTIYPNPTIIKKPETPSFNKILIPPNDKNNPYPIPDHRNNKQSFSIPDNRYNKERIQFSIPGNGNDKRGIPFQIPDSDNNKPSNPFPNSRNKTQSMPSPDIWTNKQSAPDPYVWINKQISSPPSNWDYSQNIPVPGTLPSLLQKNTQFSSRGSLANQSQMFEKPVSRDSCQTSDSNIKAPPPSPEVFATDPWHDPEKVQDGWINPCVSAEPLQRDICRNVVWEKQEDAWQKRDQEWDQPVRVEVPPDDGAGTAPYPAAEQNTLKCSGGEEVEPLSPEQIRQNTYEWLRRLLALYRGKDEGSDSEAADEQRHDRCDESSDFIREAHRAPHSSEMDPDETRECVCGGSGWMGALALSPRRLGAALRGGAEALRVALREQLRRDRLKTETLQNIIEYPTHDTGPFGSECVVAGSHVAHTTAHLRPSPRLIKIAMGRPYRLNN